MTSLSPVRLKPSARWAMASLSLSMLMPSLDTSIANAGLPTLSHAFDVSFGQVRWIVLAYLLAITTLIVSAGRLGDRWGRRRVLLAGIGIFTVASLACGLAPTLGLLIAARAVQGVGAAIMLALTVALVAQTVPQESIGSAMGLLGTMSAIGTTLGPSLGGVLMAGVGWPAIFLVNVPLGLINGLLAWRYLPADSPNNRREPARFDIRGTLLLALTLAAYALAMTLDQFNALLLLATVCGAGLFVWSQRRTASPLIQLASLRHWPLSAGLCMSVLVSTVIMSTLVVGPFYLARGLGLDAMTVGLLLSAGPCVSALSGVPAGRWVDRFGAWPMAVVGLLAMALGSAALSLLPMSSGIVGYIAALVVLTAGYAQFQAANNTAIMSTVLAPQRGVIAGLLSLSRNLGLISGASFMGAVFVWGQGTPGLSPVEAVGVGMRSTFAVACGLIVTALAIACVSQARHTECVESGRLDVD